MNLPAPESERTAANSDMPKQRRYLGLALYQLAGVLTTIAFVASVYAVADCNFAERYVTLREASTPDSACTDAGYEGGNLKGCVSLLEDHVVGFRGFGVTPWQSNQRQVCVSYTQPTPWGYATPAFDVTFTVARILGIVAVITGGVLWLTLMLAACFSVDPSKMHGLSVYVLAVTLCQGLSLLLFSSNVCDAGFFSLYFSDPNAVNLLATGGDQEVEAESVVADVTCGLSTGSTLAIVAIVCWMVCAVIFPFVVVPAPLWTKMQNDEVNMDSVDNHHEKIDQEQMKQEDEDNMYVEKLRAKDNENAEQWDIEKISTQSSNSSRGQVETVMTDSFSKDSSESSKSEQR